MTSAPADLTTGDEAARLRHAATVFGSLVPAIQEWCATLPPGAELGFVGCGSSLDIPEALVDAAGRGRAVSASEFVPESGATWVAVTRSGTTREVLGAMSGGVIDHVITCGPDAPVARPARHVLDLSPAADTGFVAALSAIVTAAAIAVALGEDPDDVARALRPSSPGRRGLGGVPAVAWLGPWRAYPIARELTRKSIETGRRASFAHQFEFLHGDDQMYPPGTAWVLLGDEAANESFVTMMGADRHDQVVRLDVDWERMTPLATVELLAATYELIFTRAKG